LLEQLADPLAIGVAAARTNSERERLEAVRPICEHQIAGPAGGLRQHFADRRDGIRALLLETSDPIVQRQASFLDTSQDQGCRDDLRQPVEMKRRVSARRIRALDVFLAEEEWLDGAIDGDDRGGKTRDAGLR